MISGLVNPQGRSPYQRYGKTPYRYSPAYYAWRRETLCANGLRESEAQMQAERDADHRRKRRGVHSHHLED